MEFIMLFILSLIIAVIAIFVWLASKKKKDRNNAPYPSGPISLLVACVFGILALLQCFTQIPAGHVGVVDFFGIVSAKPLPAGINLVNPLANVVKFSIQTKEHKETMQVLSREGLTIGLEVSALYRLNPDSAARVYKRLPAVIMKPLFLFPSSVLSAVQ
jgi:prohibitin 1